MQGASYSIEVESGDFVEKAGRVDLPEFPVNVDQLIVLLKYKHVLEKTVTKDNLKITAFFAGSLDSSRAKQTDIGLYPRQHRGRPSYSVLETLLPR